MLEATYLPKHLVSFQGHLMTAQTKIALEALYWQAHELYLEMVVVSAYRSLHDSLQIKKRYPEHYPFDCHEDYHQAGICVDLLDERKDYLHYANSPLYLYLKHKGPAFGLIQPEEKCPWHYQFVGRGLALFYHDHPDEPLPLHLMTSPLY